MGSAYAIDLITPIIYITKYFTWAKTIPLPNASENISSNFKPSDIRARPNKTAIILKIIFSKYLDITNPRRPVKNMSAIPI
jgi:hypothetical protein